MIVVTERGVTEKQIEEIIRVMHEHGFDVHRSTGVQQTVLGAIGVHPEFDHRQIALLPGVAEVVRITEQYKLASRAFKREGSVFDIGGVKIGGDPVVVMAGPCSVENEEQIDTVARLVSASGAKILRGGAFKPRTSPYSFQGLGEEGLKIMAEARAETGLPFVAEVVDPRDVGMVEGYADALRVGARNMANFALLAELGRQRKPVILKRGLTSTIEEWLLAAEYVAKGGNEAIIFCERGIRTFEPATRFTLDISAVPVLKQETHLPVMVDPSHAAGRRYAVKTLALEAVAVGADGFMIDVHPCPEEALCDGPQALLPEEFEELMAQVRPMAEIMGKHL